MAHEGDRRALRDGAWTTFAGHALRAGQPLLLILATRAYGSVAFGRFITLQAVSFVLARIALQGLDRAVLATVARAYARGEPTVLGAAALRVALAGALGGAALAAWAVMDGSVDHGALVMAASVPFIALAELLVQVSAATGSLRVQVALRDVMMPTISVGGAVLLAPFVDGVSGLAWGYLAATLSTVVVGTVVLARRHGVTFASVLRALPGRVRRLAGPLFAADLLETVLARADVLLLAALVPAEIVGVYAVVQQVLRTMRSLRTAFEPAVIAVSARLHAESSDVEDRVARTRESVACASRYVAGAQWAVVAALAIAGRPILGYFGEGFEVGATAAVAGSALLAVAGPLAVAGAALIGLGDTRSQPLATAAALVTQGVALLVLVPIAPLEGAAIACGAAAIAQGVALRLRFAGAVDRIAALREA